jgi:lysine 2,3-aminomutase
LNKSAELTKQPTCQVEEEEPPGAYSSGVVLEDEEPPSSSHIAITERFFSNVQPSNWNDWRWQFQNRITSLDQLVKYIPLSESQKERISLVTERFPLSITPYYLSLINVFDQDDPIRKQSVPSFEEISLGAMGFEDPLEERRDSVVPGLVHRYPDRVLMVLTDLCPMLCRHCTRKREWHKGFWVRTTEEVDAMIDYIRKTRAVRDVIISGGDPLTLSTKRLEEVIKRLRQIDHVEIIRIGTRFPVVLPQRIDNELCDMLSNYGPIWLNTHFNHPNEITPDSAAAVERLVRAGVLVNNQTVLLRGINDSLETQLKLCRGLLKIKVRPYYLFQCDEVQGTEHLRTTVETGVKIMEGMRGRTSGLAIPTFVVDLPQGGGKVPVLPNYLLSKPGEELIFKNYQGHYFRYRNPRNSMTNTMKTANQKDRAQMSFPVQIMEGKEKIPVRVGVKNANRSGIRS